MKPRALLVLAVVVAALGAFIWFVERDLPSTDERGARAKRVLPLEVEEVTALEIRVEGAVTRLERAEAPAASGGEEEDENVLDVPAPVEWRLVAPLSARADADAVSDLIDELTGLEKERTLEDVEPADLGLDPPRASVTLTAGGEDHVLRVGESVPASSNLIVGVDDRAEAFVVADSFWEALVQPAGDWRSREAFAADRDDIEAIELRGAVEVRLRRDDEVFRVEAPYRDEASEEKVGDLMAALTGLEIATFLDGPLDPQALGLAPPAATVTVRLAGDDAPVEIAVGSPVGDDESARNVALGDQHFTAETELVDLAGLDPAMWRSTAWSRLEVYEIDAVEVRRDGATMKLERVAGDWRRDGAEIAYATASDLLYAVRDAKTLGVGDRETLSLVGEPLVELTLTSADRSETLRLYPATPGGHPAEREGRQALVLVDGVSVADLLAKIDAVEDTEPIAAPDPDGASDA